jgi:hypothetical protein
MTGLLNTRPITIAWGDCDPAGIVFYPRYFEYFDACTGALFLRALGMPKPRWTALHGIVGIPMVDTRSRFSVPSVFGDEVVVGKPRHRLPPLQLRCPPPPAAAGWRAGGGGVRDPRLGGTPPG